MDQLFQNNPASSLAFFSSEPHLCSYLSNELSVSLFADPSAKMTNEIYVRLINFGFRRSGSFVYAPNCPRCHACQSMRVQVSQFRPNRSQQRAVRQNSDLTVIQKPAAFEQEHFELYRRYLHTRHAGSSMENPSPEDYMNFLNCDWSDTVFFEFRDAGKLISVAVTDVLPSGLSAVYTFYEPDAQKRSLGKYAILKLIEETQKRGLEWFYLGYWIDNCQKMQYKSEYQPAEIFTNGLWKPFPRL